ncbi:MAG: trypsin-like peptidase domain-containing protein [Brumimicrobium sp.]|nr:trypsin-like peptidase domain-containing protein [Brumimicrobium sp.]
MNAQDIIEKYRSYVVQIATGSSTGTGFFIAEHQLIATNYHVIKGNWVVTVRGELIDSQSAKVIFTHPRWDIAFLQIETPIGVQESLLTKQEILVREGDSVIAIGHPFGLTYSATQGVISRNNRKYEGMTYFQTDTPINPGNSGGPLINLNGKIIGMNTFIIDHANNIGFALPYSYINEALNTCLQFRGATTTVCPSCLVPVFEGCVDMEKYCMNCGTEVELPGNQQEIITEVKGDVASVIEKALELMRCSPIECRNGENRWTLTFGDTTINIFYQPHKYTIYVDGTMGEIPKENIGDLYEYMLRENDNDDLYYFFTVQGNVYISAAIPNMEITAQECHDIFRHIFEKCDDYFQILRDHFGVEPTVFLDT